ncbi:MAG TPA: ATP-binding cassette domain-containing protein [Pyrinomonadaceae bacterium]|jgi:branched-chain amino acid transport system ATP-binding protein
MALLEVKNINAGYGKKQVLYDVSFSVERGDIVLLIGSNGSGKSTLLKAVYGLLPLQRGGALENPSGVVADERGSIRFDGEDIGGMPASNLLKKGLLYIPQQNNLFADLTVKENLEMAGLTINSQQLLRERIEESLTVFPTLVPHLNRIPMKLSGGERQLLALAMAILHQPRMILIDEPFNGLSPQNITFVRENLKMLNEKAGISFLIVEHRIKESYILARKIVSLKLGKVYRIEDVDLNFDARELQGVFV